MPTNRLRAQESPKPGILVETRDFVKRADEAGGQIRFRIDTGDWKRNRAILGMIVMGYSLVAQGREGLVDPEALEQPSQVMHGDMGQVSVTQAAGAQNAQSSADHCTGVVTLALPLGSAGLHAIRQELDEHIDALGKRVIDLLESHLPKHRIQRSDQPGVDSRGYSVIPLNALDIEIMPGIYNSLASAYGHSRSVGLCPWTGPDGTQSPGVMISAQAREAILQNERPQHPGMPSFGKR